MEGYSGIACLWGSAWGESIARGVVPRGGPLVYSTDAEGGRGIAADAPHGTFPARPGRLASGSGAFPARTDTHRALPSSPSLSAHIPTKFWKTLTLQVFSPRMPRVFGEADALPRAHASPDRAYASPLPACRSSRRKSAPKGSPGRKLAHKGRRAKNSVEKGTPSSSGRLNPIACLRARPSSPRPKGHAPHSRSEPTPRSTHSPGPPCDSRCARAPGATQRDGLVTLAQVGQLHPLGPRGPRVALLFRGLGEEQLAPPNVARA